MAICDWLKLVGDLDLSQCRHLEFKTFYVYFFTSPDIMLLFVSQHLWGTISQPFNIIGWSSLLEETKNMIRQSV